MASLMSASINIAEPPVWLLQAASRQRSRDPRAGEAIVELDTPWAVERAMKYLAEESEEASEGARNANAYKAAVRLMDFGLSYEKCLELMEPWNTERNGDLPHKELERCIESAITSRDDPIGRDHPETKCDAFDVIVPAPTPGPADLLEFPEDVDLARLISEQSNYLIKGLMFPGETSVMYGPSRAGKTFVALDMAWHIAIGKNWHGLRVRRCPVLYVSLEGTAGFRKRMKAAQQAHGDPGKHFARLRPHVSLVRADVGAQGVAQIATAAHALAEACGEPVGLILIDTLSRAMAGDDENSASDMMHFIEQRMGAIAQQTGAAVQIIHHPGKSGSIRGSSTLIPSFETVLRVDRDEETDKRTVVKEKVKDGVEGPLFGFSLQVVDLGIDAEGEAVTSCVVKFEPHVSEDAARAAKLRGIADWAEPLLRDAIDAGERLSTKRMANTYFGRWLLAQTQDYSMKDIEHAYLQFLRGRVFVEGEMPDERDRPVKCLVPVR